MEVLFSFVGAAEPACGQHEVQEAWLDLGSTRVCLENLHHLVC